jgi:hypothetical protein
MAPNHELIRRHIMRRSRVVAKEQLFSMPKYCDAQTCAAAEIAAPSRHAQRLQIRLWLFGGDAMTFATQFNQCAHADELG